MKGLTFFGGWKYEKKIPVFVASTVAMSMMLGACSYQKMNRKQTLKGIAEKAARSKLLT